MAEFGGTSGVWLRLPKTAGWGWPKLAPRIVKHDLKKCIFGILSILNSEYCLGLPGSRAKSCYTSLVRTALRAKNFGVFDHVLVIFLIFCLG